MLRKFYNHFPLEAFKKRRKKILYRYLLGECGFFFVVDVVLLFCAGFYDLRTKLQVFRERDLLFITTWFLLILRLNCFEHLHNNFKLD